MKVKSVILLFSLIMTSLNVMAQGLQFKSTANSIEKRTSYDVFCNKKLTFRHFLDIKFQMQLPWQDEVGYVVRIVDEEQKQKYNVFFEGRGGNYFALNEEGNKVLILQRYNRQRLMKKHWFEVELLFNFDRQTISLSIDGQKKTVKKTNLPSSLKPNIIFGRSDYLIDVPTFAMRDLSIKSKGHGLFFPLRQVSGNVVYDEDGKEIGHVDNPYWLLNDHYHWRRIFSSNSNSPTGYNYDEKHHTLLYYNRQTLHQYDIMSGNASTLKFPSLCPVKLYLGTSFIDGDHNKLYTYEIYRDGKRKDEASVASMDLTSHQWQKESVEQISEGPMHHHGAWFDNKRGEFNFYGGFARMRYHSSFYTYSISQHKWIVRSDIKGKKFPRYFLSLGYDGKRYVYMFGGMGNESGDQTVGRVYYYDLHRLDTRTNKLTKLWDAKVPQDARLVFSKGMVIEGKYFYTLGYSEYLSDTYLKLYRFCIKSGSWQVLGDSIPIHSDRIESEANLYYDKLLRRFIATMMEYKDSKRSTFKAYIINSPALSEAEFKEASKIPNNNIAGMTFLAIVVLAILAIAVFFIFFKKEHQNKNIIEDDSTDDNKILPRKNSIYLFGEFLACDRKGNDISYMFTGKLKIILCLILQYNGDGGISSQHLGNLVWGDKSPEKIKNSRSVAINHLRKVLAEMDDVSLIYSSGKFRLEYQRNFYCDYLYINDLIDEGVDTDETRREFLEVLKRGKFLLGSNSPLLDSFKSSLEDKLIPALKAMLRKAVNDNNSKAILMCTQAIFHIDPTDEEAYQIQMKTLKKTGQTLAALEAQIRFKEAAKDEE